MANDINIVVAAQVQGAIGPLQQVQKQVGMVDRSVNQSTAALRRNATQYNSTSVATNKFAKGALQQAGYQIGDYAVQVANGTSKMQAFGQQGSQLLGIFGPVGAVLGAVVAIVSAFAVVAERAGKATKSTTDAMIDINSVNLGSIRSAVSDLTSIQKAYNEAVLAGGGASSTAAKLVIANSEAEFNARKQLLTVERELLRLRSQDQIQALANLQSQQDALRRGAMETLRTIGPGATFDVRRETGGFAGAGPAFEEIERAVGGTLERLRENRRQILVLQSELTRLGIASDEAAAAVSMVFNADPVAEGGGDAGGSTKKGIDEITRAMNEVQERMKSLRTSIEGSMESAFMSIVDGTKSTRDAFRAMAADIIKQLYRVLVVQRLVAGISDAISLFTGAPPGSTASILSRPGVSSFAGGGYTGMGSRSGGVDGRGGFPAILHPNETVVDHAQGQGMGTVVINQTINVSTGVQQTVRAEIKQLLPQIAESAKAAVVDAKRRGGSYGRAFA